MSLNVPGQTEKDPQRIVAAVRALAEGRSNAVVTATLTPSATTTTVKAPNCSENSVVLWVAMSASAVGPGIWIEPKNGEFVVTHTSSAATDRLIGFVALG